MTTMTRVQTPEELQKAKRKEEKRAVKKREAEAAAAESKKRKQASTPPSSAPSSDIDDILTAVPNKTKKARVETGTAAAVSNTSVTSADDGLEAMVAGATKVIGKPLSEFPRIPKEILTRFQKNGFTTLFPIQAATFDYVYDGKDVMGRARTGTGKTLAFALPICSRLHETKVSKQYGRRPRVLVLTPTRELAKQIEGEFNMITPDLSVLTVYGGTPYGPQQGALRKGVDIVVGTCGRIKDLLEKGNLNLNDVAHVVMDEADEMLNMGFADDVELILKSVTQTGNKHQTLLFSATIPSWVQNVARKYLQPDRHYVDLVGDKDRQSSENISHYAVNCHWQERNSVLRSVIDVYGTSGARTKTIIFCETKKDCNELATQSSVTGDCQVIHGDISQQQRESTLQGFREGRFDVLVATDVAARGIDISNVELVIQCEPPKEVETYIHRSGRTGRAGKQGVSLVFFGPKHLFYLNQIERVAKVKFNRVAVPQGAEIVASAAKLAVKQTQQVHSSVVKHFMPYAKQLMEAMQEHDYEAEEIIARCLAQSAGVIEPLKQRSILSSLTGWVTVQLTVNSATPIRSPTFVWQMIKRHLMGPEEADSKVRGMKLSKDRRAAVFDVPAEYEDKVRNINTGNDRSITFSIPTALPPLDIPEPNGGGSSFGARGGGFRAGANRFGSRGGGRGGGRGGFRR